MRRAAAPLPVAVIGSGRIARAVHLPLIMMRPDLFKLVAIIETDPRRAASAAREYAGVTVSGDLGAALGAARAAICATPWPTHAAIITEALRHGVHVLTEKPVSLDEAEIRTLLDAESSSGATVAVGYMKRHDPAAERFTDAVAARLDRMRLIRADIVDPDSPRQAAHRVACPLEPSVKSRAVAGQAVRAVLGDASEGQLAVYGRGLGGSLIHQVNLVGHALRGTRYKLLGRIRYGAHWAGGTAVSCGWWPADGFGVQMTHVRAPAAPRYLEVLQAVAEDSVLTLQAPSPYLLEQAMTFTEESGGHVASYLAGPEGHGFVRQLERWAAFARGDGPALPGLAEALRDLAVVREAALACSGAPEDRNRRGTA